MKPIIGIVSNFNYDERIRIEDSYVSAIERAGGEPIGLITKEEDVIGINVLNACDGFLFQGGSRILEHHLNVLDYAYKHNKPVIGICLGHQLLGIYFGGTGCLKPIALINPKIYIGHKQTLSDDKAKSDPVHDIYISEDSYMYKLFGSKIKVNSRHSRAIVNVPDIFKISAKSEDGIIEAIEYIDDNNYIIGTQFHPENVDYLSPIFEKFVERCKK